MTLSVVGSGFGRTGTRSLKEALEFLGFGPCHHMEEVYPSLEQTAHWLAALAGEPVDWNAVFTGYRSQIDWPGAHFWRELAAAFPDAKVIHSVRPDEAWWNSFRQTIGKAVTLPVDKYPLPPHALALTIAVRDQMIIPTIGPDPLDRDAALAAYRRREAEVRAAIAPERLLVFDVAQGWEPLCRFLGVSVPDAPFPRRNTKDDFWEKFGGEPG